MKKFYLLLITVMSFAAATAQTHFQPAFEGNGYDHMNIYIVESTIEGMAMEVGDEIAVFDGDVCAGVFVLTQAYIDGALGAINASKADSLTAGNGYVEGNIISFKLWDASAMTEYDNVDIVFVDSETGLEIAPVPFTVGGTVFVRLKYQCILGLQYHTLSDSSSSGEQYMWVYSNTDWAVENLPSWLTVSPSSGTGNMVIKVSWSANTGEARIGDIVFGTTCEGVKDTLTVNQEAVGCILGLQYTTIDASSSSGEQYMWVYSNTDWTVDQLPSWLTVNKLSGTGNMVIKVSWSANTGEARSGDIVFGTSCEGVSSTLTVNQESLQKSSYLLTGNLDLNDNKYAITSQVYPNPFRSSVTIEFLKEKEESVCLLFYDLQGKLIYKMDNCFKEGLNKLDWDSTDGNNNKVQPGMYIIQLQSDLRNETFKVIYQGE